MSEQQIVYPPTRTWEAGPIGLTRAARATDSIGTLLTQRKRVRHASFIATNPLQRENRKGELQSISSAGRFERESARADGAKDGNAEAGSSGGWPPRTARAQPVSVAGTKTSREAA